MIALFGQGMAIDWCKFMDAFHSKSSLAVEDGMDGMALIAGAGKMDEVEDDIGDKENLA